MSAVLPSPIAAYVGLHLGWSVVLAWLGVTIAMGCWPGWRAHTRRLQLVAGVAAVSAWFPGPYASAYWLGLVFQTPSTMAVLLCAAMLWRPLRGAPVGVPAGGVGDRGDYHAKLAWVVMGVLMGWALLLDSFALLPVAVYASGFSPTVSGLVLLALLLPWVGLTNPTPAKTPWCGAGLALLCLLVCVVWRLPTGNVWDAVLDPLLWLTLQGYLLRAAWLHGRSAGPRAAGT